MDTTIFKKGIPRMALKSKWRNLLLIIQNFVTCEGRFGCMCFYHIPLLMNFLEENEINLLYFLLKSLRKMSQNVQRRIQFIDNTMYHHGLIKILVEFHLQKIGDNWERILVRNHFLEETHGKPNSSRPKRGRKIKIDKTHEQEPKQPHKLSEDDIPLAEVLEKINERNVRRKNSNKETEISSQREKPKTERKKT